MDDESAVQHDRVVDPDDWSPAGLDELVSRLIDQRSIPVLVDRRLRVGGLLGLAVVMVLTVAVGAGTGMHRRPHPGLFLFGWSPLRALLWGSHAGAVFWTGVVICGFGIVAAAATRGFASVRPSLLPGVFGLVVAGCLAGTPLTIAATLLLMNVAAWLALGVLCIVVAVLAIAALLGALGGG